MNIQKNKYEALMKKLQEKQKLLEEKTILLDKISSEISSYKEDNAAYEKNLIELQSKITEFQKQYETLLESDTPINIKTKENKKKILIIGSSAVVKAKAKKIFNNKLFELFFASDLEESKTLDTNGFSVIITDLEHSVEGLIDILE